MRTRRSWKNQDKLWKELGGNKGNKILSPTKTADEINAMWWLSKTSRNALLREVGGSQAMTCEYCGHDHKPDPFYCIARLTEKTEQAEAERDCAYTVIDCMQIGCAELRKQLAEMTGSENEMANRYGAAHLEMEIYKKRYEVLRCMNPDEFHKLWSNALVGNFDKIVDSLASGISGRAEGNCTS